MKEYAIVLSDDLDWAENKERVPADETVTLSLDGTVRELDLTQEHLAELRAILERWLAAGRKPESAPPGRPVTERKRRRFIPGAREYKKDLRDWADETGLRAPRGPDRPAYMTTTMKYTYPPWLLRAWEEHLAGADGGMPPAG